MNRLFLATILLSAWSVCGSIAGAQPLAAHGGSAAAVGHWDLERVVLGEHQELRGYIESEDPNWLNLVQIERPANRPMFLVIRPIPRDLVSAIDRLDAEQREQLRQRIDAFRNRALIQAARAEAIELTPVAHGNRPFRSYRGRWFIVETDVHEPLARQMIVRLEQVFTAYRQVLPPREKPSRPLRLRVFGSMPAYRDCLARSGINTRAPACFVPEDNLVAAGTRLNQLAAVLEELAARDAQLRARLEDLERQLRERLQEAEKNLRRQGVPPAVIRKLAVHEAADVRRDIANVEKALRECARNNDRALEGFTAEAFSRLAHEAFHAYLENYVYPQKRYDVPRWLNEGLAVMFEQGQLDTDTLRVDAPNRAALARLREDLGRAKPLTLDELLTSGPAEFLDEDSSNRHYAHAWAVVYYLTFERGLLDDPALDRYVQPKAAPRPPVERFEQFVGMPLDAFERRWRAYVREL